MRMDAQQHKAEALELRQQLLLASHMPSDHLDPQHCLLAILMDLAGNPLQTKYPRQQAGGETDLGGFRFQVFRSQNVFYLRGCA